MTTLHKTNMRSFDTTTSISHNTHVIRDHNTINDQEKVKRTLVKRHQGAKSCKIENRVGNAKENLKTMKTEFASTDVAD